MYNFYTLGYKIEKLENNLLFIRSEIEIELSKEKYNVNWEFIKDLSNKAFDLEMEIIKLKEERLKSI